MHDTSPRRVFPQPSWGQPHHDLPAAVQLLRVGLSTLRSTWIALALIEHNMPQPSSRWATARQRAATEDARRKWSAIVTKARDRVVSAEQFYLQAMGDVDFWEKKMLKEAIESNVEADELRTRCASLEAEARGLRADLGTLRERFGVADNG